MEIAKQKGKFILNQKYKRSKDLLDKTTKLAKEIAEEAPKIKEQTEAQVKENLSLVKGMLAETAMTSKKLPVQKVKRL
jgi:sensor domain CHASE-containing protein